MRHQYTWSVDSTFPLNGQRIVDSPNTMLTGISPIRSATESMAGGLDEGPLSGHARILIFLIENGKIQAGIRNFRFNESLIHMLSNVEAMGQTRARQRRGILRHGRSGHEGSRL